MKKFPKLGTCWFDKTNNEFKVVVTGYHTGEHWIRVKFLSVPKKSFHPKGSEDWIYHNDKHDWFKSYSPACFKALRGEI